MKSGSLIRIDNEAFTIVENVVALGIVASVMLAIVAMLPVGMSAVGDSVDLSVKAMIARAVVAEMNDPGSAVDGADMMYFDGHGNATKPDAPLRRYTVWIERTDPARLPSTGALLPSRRFQRCVIRIASVPDAQKEYFGDPEHRTRVFTVAAVVRSEQDEGPES